MIAWSIEEALRSGLFKAVIVSTDDAEIAKIAQDFGAEVPFLRPTALSNDEVGVRRVIQHGIEALGEQGRSASYFCSITATAPFLRAEDLRRAFEMLNESGADFCYSLAKYSYPIQRAVRLDSEGRVEMMNPAFMAERSQEMGEAYHDAGQFYWGRRASFLDNELRIPSPASVALILPSHRVQDIDTLDDWIRAEWMCRAMKLANAYRKSVEL
jgi:pseudaminic acid cytidylyltransferase